MGEWPDRIKALCKVLAVSAAGLARRIDATPAAVCHWRTGRYAPSGPYAARLEDLEREVEAGRAQPDHPENWPARIARLMESQGWSSYKEMSSATGIPPWTLSRWVNGKANPSRRHRKLIEALEEEG